MTEGNIIAQQQLGRLFNWYEARLENAAERRRHTTDLNCIISDPENRAIYELAENPLLLTIICLVHRIDAVLPDERVVLYQKCTETLLNTWHAWKFHSEETRSRNKVEQRNRARMEAIAYWMHCLLGVEARLPARKVTVQKRADGRVLPNGINGSAASDRAAVLAELHAFLSEKLDVPPVLLKAAGAFAVRATSQQVRQFSEHPLVKSIRPNRRLR